MTYRQAVATALLNARMSDHDLLDGLVVSPREAKASRVAYNGHVAHECLTRLLVAEEGLRGPRLSYSERTN